ncbi:hypothetical protein [Mycobacteroides chelonae]|uniref:hypothetical protein n=1 Tax=Mycobacteroides chelonae TaxID=1774 RepID=UPI001C2B9266|nr:hypothetical protein [Mycobacteroides chelonae]MBV0919495.1 hypothetical protein [Mycobacteroides chelonae]
MSNNNEERYATGGHTGHAAQPSFCAEETSRVRSEDYGMHYDPHNYLAVELARAMLEESWCELPIQNLPAGTVLEANEETLKKRSIDNVVNGVEPFRHNYVIKLWRDDAGRLHVCDGHHRVAMYYALGKEIPVRIMDSASCQGKDNPPNGHPSCF